MKSRTYFPPNLLSTAYSLKLCLSVLFVATLLLLTSQISAEDSSAEVAADATYRLGAGDQLQIDVFNQADLSGEYTLDGNGRFDMHLIGQIEAADLTPDELEEVLVSKLKPDYLLNPRVSVQVQNYRPFYIIGEVNSPSSYDYVDGMTYLNAVAIAGGFTYRAKKDYAYIVRGDDPEKKELKLDISVKVQPGDIIRIAERMF